MAEINYHRHAWIESITHVSEEQINNGRETIELVNNNYKYRWSEWDGVSSWLDPKYHCKFYDAAYKKWCSL